MTRTTARQIAIQLSFAAAAADESADVVLARFFDRDYFSSLGGENRLFAEYPDDKQLEYIRTLTTLICQHRQELDSYIEKYSKGWKLNRISGTARAVLRCAMCEVLFMDDVPNAAAINEAVELAKGYDEPETVSFINGIMGSFVKGELGAIEIDGQ